MKKILTISLFVFLIVGLFVSCNADAVKTVYGSDCYIGISGGVKGIDNSYAFAIVKDSQSKWHLLMAKGSISEGQTEFEVRDKDNIELFQSGDTLSKGGSKAVTTASIKISLSSKQYVLNRDSHDFTGYLIPATIVTQYKQTTTPGDTILECNSNGKTYKFFVYEN